MFNLRKLRRLKVVVKEWVELVGGDKPAQLEQVSGGRGGNAERKTSLTQKHHKRCLDIRNDMDNKRPMETVETMDTAYISVSNLARRFGISRAFAYNLVGEGWIRSIRISGAIRVPLEEVERIDREGLEVMILRPSPATKSSDTPGT